MRVATLAAVAAISLAAVGQANAAIISGTVSGTVASGMDTEGLFGPKNLDLSGQAFSIAFNFDTTQGEVLNPFDPSAGLAVGGGVNVFGFGTNSPGGGGFTLNGITLNALAQGSLLTANDAGGGAASNFLFLFDPGTNSRQISVSFGIAPLLFPDLNTPFSGNPCPGAFICTGSFSFDGGISTGAAGVLTPDFYSIATDGLVSVPPIGGGAVPEPGTWAMMLAGFFGLGVALRRRAALA